MATRAEIRATPPREAATTHGRRTGDARPGQRSEEGTGTEGTGTEGTGAP